jgi:hypothetical protein
MKDNSINFGGYTSDMATNVSNIAAYQTHMDTNNKS